MRIVNPRLLASFKEATRCEWCGRHFGPGYVVAHHILSRGSGGSDVPENLFGVDWICHAYIQENVPHDAQIAFLAYKLGTTAAQLTEFLWAVKRLDKSASLADVAQLRLEILGRGAA